jgi:hypothetical protein
VSPGRDARLGLNELVRKAQCNGMPALSAAALRRVADETDFMNCAAADAFADRSLSERIFSEQDPRSEAFESGKRIIRPRSRFRTRLRRPDGRFQRPVIDRERRPTLCRAA